MSLVSNSVPCMQVALRHCYTWLMGAPVDSSQAPSRHVLLETPMALRPDSRTAPYSRKPAASDTRCGSDLLTMFCPLVNDGHVFVASTSGACDK